MLVQKTFHLHALKEVAKAHLVNLSSYRRQFADVELAVVTPEGNTHFIFRLPWGFRGDVELVPMPNENPSQTLFRSSRGNIEVLGVLEYFQIRPGLTEVVLTLDYTIRPFLFRIVDRFNNTVDRFLNQQLMLLEAHFDRPLEGIRADTHLPTPINHHPK